jgi:aminomethyltransferase
MRSRGFHMGNKTALYQAHLDAGGKIVDFGGWDMPLHYGSQIEEHHIVRKEAGVFDVSHMTIVDLNGDDATRWLQYLLANDVDKLGYTGKALYSGMLNEQGGVIDDLIVYRMPEGYRLVVNCATREKDLAWMKKQSAGYAITLNERPDLAMLAVQGPKAIELACSAGESSQAEIIRSLKVFQGLEDSQGWMFCRTGYTGEDGLEIMIPDAQVSEFWRKLLDAGVAPCGLGARDTLRLEAGMNLYGSDMDESISPLQAAMGWTIAWEPANRNFIGRAALEQEKAQGVQQQLVGLVLGSRGILRNHQTVFLVDDEGNELGQGEITSGSFSPTLGHSIAFARIPVLPWKRLEVDIRGKRFTVDKVRPPFVRNGQKVFE